MTAFRISILVLIFVAGAIIINSVYIERLTEGLVEKLSCVNENDPKIAEQELSLLYDEFMRAEKIISLTVSHSDLTNIEEAFAEIIGAAKAKDVAAIITIKSRLGSALKHLGRLSGINFYSII